MYFCEEKHYFGGVHQRPTAKEEINKRAQGRMAVKAGGNNGDGGRGCEGRRRTTGGGVGGGGGWRMIPSFPGGRGLTATTSTTVGNHACTCSYTAKMHWAE